MAGQLLNALTKGDVSHVEKLWDDFSQSVIQRNLNVIYDAAALSGNKDMVKFLWNKKGVPVNYYEGAPLVYLCCRMTQTRGAKRQRQLEMVRFLIRSGIDVNARGGDPCVAAARNGDLELLQILVSRGGNPRAQGDHALILASSNGYPEVVEYLLSKGANPNADNGNPMYFAATNGHVACARVLVAHGADVNINDGVCLAMAEENNHWRMVKFLLDNGCSEDLVHYEDTFDRIAELPN